MSFTTCPTNAIPEDSDLNIDSKSLYAVIPRANTTANDIPDPWMVSCCEPNPVKLASNSVTGACWQWCDLPPRYTNQTTDRDMLLEDFTFCVSTSASYKNSTVKPNIFHVSAAARDGVVGDGMVGLAVVLGLAVWRLFM